VDNNVLQRLAAGTLEARGSLSQREFAQKLGVSQSTVQSWENCKNVPSLDNLEKLAQMQGMLVEDFVAYLYGRRLEKSNIVVMDQIDEMPSTEIADVLRILADRLDKSKIVIAISSRPTNLSEQEQGQQQKS